MITCIALQPDGEWTRTLVRRLPEGVAMLHGRNWRDTLEIASTVPTSLVLFELTRLTDELLVQLREVVEQCSSSTVVCLVAEEILEDARSDTDAPNIVWITMPLSEHLLGHMLKTVWERIARLKRAPERRSPAASCEGEVVRYETDATSDETFYRLLGCITRASDHEQLFTPFLETVRTLTRCVTYCLLWAENGGGTFQVKGAHGLHPSLVAGACLQAGGGLPLWLRRTRRVATREALGGGAQADDEIAAWHELEVFSGVLAVPMFSDAALRGILIVGARMVDRPYTAAELETLYLLASQVALAAEQMELQHQLSSQKSYMERILSTMRSGLVGLDPEGKISVCNEYAAEVLGINGGDAVGDDLRLLPSPLGDYLYEALVGQMVRANEIMSIRGGRTIIRASISPLPGEQGQTIGSLAVFEDITAEAKLAEQRRLAERVEMLNQFVARVAHELKNPLSTIHTFAELMPSKSSDEEFQQFWSEVVTRDIARVDELVRKMVSLVELPQGDLRDTAVAEVLENTLDDLAELDAKARNDLEVDMAEGLPAMHVDPSRLSSALVHLLRYCTGRYEGPVRIRARRGSNAEFTDAVFIEITVPRKDAEEVIEDVLDPVYALEHPDVDLGPAASQRLVESLGGSVQVVSLPDRAGFCCIVPAAASAVTAVNTDEETTL